ncbi:gibberellin cluster-kaurensynthase [Pyrenophora seminiperda CCB06]|uniref:Gibberellin cluster-kaurensynthase n=1 Tax=Pyrenophora seminiperda CCB06 TaxID=1302712 RepID=A0A3M7ME60_9PLEO|nr:gibberellin cluster-kaurensynthase [Pyrenophora seminiperda CCB06]
MGRISTLNGANASVHYGNEFDGSHSPKENLCESAKSLVQRALGCLDPKYGFSTASCQIYDTAWVSMISKETVEQKEWLFPECFHYLLRTQRGDGSWGIDSISQTTGILDTAAALLALQKHAADPLQIQDYSHQELAERIDRASKSLARQLATWNDMETTNHIGVELIVPALLQYLKEEDAALQFAFPGQSVLADMSAAKLARFRTEMLYEARISPASYSMEAFIGKVDFDRVALQLRNGSMWTSPSSTAAYLMYTTTWDTEAEDWLRHLIQAGQGHGDGSVPGTFPTHQFELNWVIATLLQSGFSLSDFDSHDLDKLARIVRAGFVSDGGGTVDVDDTAKGLIALKLLGKQEDITPDIMISLFEKNDAFGTMAAERDRSISSNCHVLLALLAWSDYPQYGPQIHKAAKFVCESWWNCSGRYKDKWVKSFSLLLSDVDAGLASELLGQDLSIRTSIATFQACFRTLLEQHRNGSWEDSPEQTAYAVLILREARCLSFFAEFADRLQYAIDAGVDYLKRHNTAPLIPYWTSKTRYSVKFVAEAYILSAKRASLPSPSAGTVGHTLNHSAQISKTQKFFPLMKLTAHFSSMPDWKLQAALTESALFLPLLRTRRLEVFPRDKLRVSKDAYFDMLPFLWVGCAYRLGLNVPTTFIWDMLFMTLINIQVDEFMEDVATRMFENDTDTLHRLIDQATNEALEKGYADFPTQAWDTCERAQDGEVYIPIVKFAHYILAHPPILLASPHDRRGLIYEFRQFLHTQTQQMSDNAAFRAQQVSQAAQIFSTSTSYFNWVRTTASDHVSTPLNVFWVRCWTSGVLHHGAEAFPTPVQDYLASALARHLATTNRMYNDLSSMARDTAEGNLNSVHFVEFNKTPSASVASQRAALASLAAYEHGCVENTLDRLEREILAGTSSGKRRGAVEVDNLAPMKLLCNVSHLWDQLYLVKDHSSTMQSDGSRG